MKVGIFDLETSSLYANSGIVLCGCVKSYGHPGVVTVRADEFPSWKSHKSDNREVVKAIMAELDKYDILVAHNGQFFDKAWLNSACLKYGFNPSLRWAKTIDPVHAARRHLRLTRNSLTAILDYFDIAESKTPIRFECWQQAALDGDKKSMGYIVEHCHRDVIALEKVYDKMRRIIMKIDERGSAQ
jgi:uncharacterized protein YprB with RNaseH-like and TPR domain